ncbi:MAG: N-acetyl-gamma-glutamyl-phosphate reductase [Verrucomicrobiales bacterium]|nr:N-acetyl-gamma-glutamyl-phosphate reductase [Verrucomicrobiales bacterium]
MPEGMISTAVVGASGYSGQELLRLLIQHPRVALAAVTSRQEAGKSLESVFPRFRGASKIAGLSFIEPDVEAIVATGARCAFLALPHGVAAEFAGPLVARGLRVIDLSADFRLNDPDVYAEFYGAGHPEPELMREAVYGLPEWRADEIRGARLVASPGCYPTSILIPLLPLVRRGLIDPGSIAVSSVSGASGAGKKADASLLFAEVNESVRAYGAPKHRHLSEIEQELSLAAGAKVTISFVPHLMPVTAGIASTIFCQPAGDMALLSDTVVAAYQEAYANAPFVRVLGEGSFPDTKHVVGTNHVDVGWVVDRRAGRLILCSAEDNLGKGASSQAVQSFNLMFDLPETEGLLHY